jgi:hypothetical protein
LCGFNRISKHPGKAITFSGYVDILCKGYAADNKNIHVEKI